MNFHLIEVLVSQTAYHVQDLDNEGQELLLIDQLAHFLLQSMLGKMIEADLILPIIYISLTYVVFHGQVWYLLVYQHDLHIVPRIVRVSLAARVAYVERAARAHRHALIRYAHVVEDLKFVTVGRRLTLHELYVGDDVLDNRAGDLLLRLVEEFTLLDPHIEAVSKEKLLLFVVGAAALVLFGDALRRRT